jgi:archaellum component FlaC
MRPVIFKIMSLTNNDLQAIGNLIDEKLEEKLEQKLEEKLEPIKAELHAHSKALKDIKSKVNRMDKTLNIVAVRYDERITKNSRDIHTIKNHLGLSTKN